MFGDSCWVANLSDGTSHVENWSEGSVSPWRRLMMYCEANHCYVTNLRMTVGKETVSCASNAIGYWQANAMPSVQGIDCDEELHKWHGIGWVDPQTLMVRIIWGTLDPVTHRTAFWTDEREAETQGQIIWGKSLLSIDPEIELPKSQKPVKNMKEYTARIELANDA